MTASRAAAVAAVLALVLAAGGDAAAQPAPSISAPGGVAAGSITGGTFHLHGGLSEADHRAIQERFDRLERGRRDELATTARILGGQIEASGAARKEAEARAARLAEELHLTRGAAVQLLAALGQQEVPPERVPERLRDAVVQYRETLARFAALDATESTAVQALRDRAQSAFQDGRFDEADGLLGEAEAAELAVAREAHTLAERARKAAEASLVRTATHRGTRGDVALTRLDYRAAAAHFAEAAALVPAVRTDDRNRWLMKQAEALYHLGMARGYADALNEAARLYDQVLSAWTRERMPSGWAAAQNNLGSTLSALGERGDGAALRRAVAAYEAVLLEYTRERAPIGWAMTQNNLGIVLVVLGRQGDVGALRRAVAAFEAALLERTRERVPLDWAATQNNLGHALHTLGGRGDDAALRRAVQAYEAALLVLERTRERVPLDWGATQHNLGAALAELGERGDVGALRRAVAAFEAALLERTRERVPLDWAATQNNLGHALHTLGARGDGDAPRRAVQAFEAALGEYTRERAPLRWATTQNNLGSALRVLGERGDRAALRRAVVALEEALEVLDLLDAPAYVAMAERNLARARALLTAR